MSATNAYGIGIMTVIIGVAISATYYQGFYLPESLEKPSINEEYLEPSLGINEISIIPGSAIPEQKDNFVPKLVNIQLGVDNLVVWVNNDDTPHTVTPDHSYAEAYSGKFGSDGVLLAGETYEYLFTEETEIEYHCEPHPWMKGKLIVTKQRF